MPFSYLRGLTGHERTQNTNRQLARYLAFIAGAVNAGGFLAVRQYTSHMSGIVSAMADNLALGSLSLLFAGFFALLSFLAGATCTSLMVRWAQQRVLRSQYALPLILESLLLLEFAFTGHVFESRKVLGTVSLLCFTMGLQNAIITKISGAVIRTTHLTGMVTDVGIKLGRIVYGYLSGTPPLANVDIGKLTLLGSLIGLFFCGGVLGALGFRHIGFLFAVPVAVVLLALSVLPVIDDLRSLRS
jgi:uncharacterized membrane protein YoaK (UPF0700 family)